MVVVTIELWPLGDEALKRPLGVAHIANDGTGTRDSCHYKAQLLTWHSPPKVWKRGKIRDFPRLRLGPWDLLYRLLREIVGSRNQTPVTPREQLLENDITAAADELLVPIPEPGTDAARMLLANRILIRESREMFDRAVTMMQALTPFAQLTFTHADVEHARAAIAGFYNTYDGLHDDGRPDEDEGPDETEGEDER